MIKINKRVESIFAQAVALEQSGKEKSIIFCKGKTIYIKNMDNTLLLRFMLGKNFFPTPFAFKADDYDSSSLRLDDDGGIIFVDRVEEYSREKKCKIESGSFANINKVFNRLYDQPELPNQIVLQEKLLGLLDRRLSHVEFFLKKGDFKIVQKDIYSGTVISIKKEAAEGLIDLNKDNLKKDFNPIGLRTNDFMSLFIFSDSLSFYFGKSDFVFFESHDISMCGFLACCIYDELGEINYIGE